jgi:hypothetical protein
MKKIYLFFVLLFINFHLLIAQKIEKTPNPHRCYTMEADAQLRAKFPEIGTLEDMEKYISNAVAHYKQKASRTTVYTIPVIVHVIHNGESVGSGQNISSEQVYSQIDVLNEDFRKLNADKNLIPSVFETLHADIEMEFCLATKDPDGNPLVEPGINRVNRNDKSFTAPPFSTNYIDNTVKPGTVWNTDDYFNIWVCGIDGGWFGEILGYAQFPNNTASLGGLDANGGSANTDGVVIGYKYFGTTSNVAAPNNKGRTLTHEAGHYFGLRHIWGDGGCSVDDFCDDTPTASSSNYGCPSFPSISCSNGPNGDMFMNYMDYVDDGCMQMFTNDQKTRIRAVMDAATPRRNSLINSSACSPTSNIDASLNNILYPKGSICETTFSPKVIIRNFGSSNLTSCVINYKIDNGAVSTYNWIGNLASYERDTITLPELTTTQGSHNLTVYTSAPNGTTDEFTNNDEYTVSFNIPSSSEIKELPFTEGFEGTVFPPADWSISAVNTSQEWELTNAVSGFENSTNAIIFNNYDYDTDADIITPNLNFSMIQSPTYLIFDVAYARYNFTYFDRLQIFASKDCGGSWDVIYDKSGLTLATAPSTNSVFVPTATQWRTDTVDLANYSQESNVIIKFSNISGNGNNLYLDNINIVGDRISSVMETKTLSSNYTIYPNPSKGVYYIKSNIHAGENINSEVVVLDMLGKEVLKKQVNLAKETNYMIDLSNQQEGVYIIQIKNNQVIYNNKIVKNN